MNVRPAPFPVSRADSLLAPLLTAAPDRPYVIAQLGQSLDGRIATPTGASRWINRGAALDHLHRLRASVDAVVVGVSTVIEDDPLLTVRRVTGPHPARVVIDPNGRVAANARCLADDGVRRVVVRAREELRDARVETMVIPAEDGWIDPNRVAAQLFASGLRKILIEGGATTISRFIDAGAVDRLHVLVAPVILGSGKPGLNLKPINAVNEARRPRTRVHILDDGDVLFDCEMRHREEG